MAISECPECENSDLKGYDDSNPARMECRDCGARVKPCTIDDCDGGVRTLVSTNYMNEWECDTCHETVLESHD